MEDDKRLPEWALLGSELIECALNEPAFTVGERLLQTVGVDSALYMLFTSTVHGSGGVGLTTKEVRALMQAAFMLGSYVTKSVGDVEKLW